MGAGDVLFVSRGPYMHAGVDMGDGTVVHFTDKGASKFSVRVRRTSKEEFLDGDEVILIKRSAAPSRVMQRAESMLGDGSYDPVFNNCQHFANWCLTGAYEESELEQTLRIATLPLAALAGLGAAVMVPAAVFCYGIVRLISQIFPGHNR